MHRWRKTVTGKPLVVLAAAASLGVAALCAGAEEVQPNVAGHPAPPLLLPLEASRPSRLELAENVRTREKAIEPMLLTRPETAEERRLQFERDYGVQPSGRSWFLNTLRLAKYGIDKMSFTAKEASRRLQFTYDFGSPTGSGGFTREPQYSLPLFGAFGHPQLKTVLTEHDPQTGTPFIGLKLAIPFGERSRGSGTATATRGD
jgi:hypothetical protein